MDGLNLDKGFLENRAIRNAVLSYIGAIEDQNICVKLFLKNSPHHHNFHENEKQVKIFSSLVANPQKCYKNRKTSAKSC